MFTFHKPRVYRSAEGCCICRAKSSRFTDSKKYEEDSIKCFDLKEPRQGEICNACVLLVKRYKRLPTGSNRHWGHVVDARAGPGMKSMTKCKKLKEESTHHSNSTSDRNHHQKSLIPEKFSKIFKKNKKKQSKDKLLKSQHTGMSTKTWESQSLPLTPESLDSDCEDVQYSPTSAIESASLKIRQAMNRNGSNKRKSLPPKRFRSTNIDKVQFFDENLWVKRKSCCGIVFENKQLGAIILDLENHIPCAEHRRKRMDATLKAAVQQPANNQQQFNTKTSAPHQISFNPPPNRNPTPVLKKHHLFFKRQSENFPLGDMKQLNNTTVAAATTIPSKTDFVLDIKVLPTTIPTSSAVKVAKLNPVDSGLLNGGTQKVTVASVAGAASPPQTAYDLHQTAHKPSGGKSNSFLHKVKSDTGKIVKHSLEKFSTLRLKPSELSDVHNMVKTVDKSFLIKPIAAAGTTTTTTAAVSVAAAQEKGKKSPTETPPGGTSTQPAATKFNDNSSDSGFDENLQDRKSVSPMQEEGEKKIMTIPVQTMYLASGVQIHGQHQNLLLAGNDVAAKILQNRKQMQNNRSGVKIAQLVAGGGVSQKMHTLYSSQPSPQDGAIITSTPSTSSSSSNIITIPSTSCTTAPSSHLSKTSAAAANIILNGSGSNGSSNIISTSSMQSLSQKIILVKTKYNSNNNNNQSTCKN